jgi:MFS family permease
MSRTSSITAPRAWLRSQALTREFWKFFAVAFFFDAGFAVYFFLFNLFLLNAHATERTIGRINGAFTLGSTLALLPAGAIAKRVGVKPLLLACMILAPLLGAGRVLTLAGPLQIGLGFLAGAAMSLWGVCYLPAVARLTNEGNRASAYSLIFSASVATSAIGGAITGFLPLTAGVLLCACAIAAIAIWPAMQLQLAPGPAEEPETRPWLTQFSPAPSLRRFLPLFALWTAVPGAFLPFANVYLVREQKLSMHAIGLLFSMTQCLQLLLGLLTPVVLRVFGLVRGILAIQLTTMLSLAGLAWSHNTSITVILYLAFTTVYWMGSPALYNLLMNQAPDSQRSYTAAMALFLNTLASSGTITLAGSAFSRFGYTVPLLTLACAGSLISLGMFWVNSAVERPALSMSSCS